MLSNSSKGTLIPKPNYIINNKSPYFNKLDKYLTKIPIKPARKESNSKPKANTSTTLNHETQKQSDSFGLSQTRSPLIIQSNKSLSSNFLNSNRARILNKSSSLTKLPKTKSNNNFKESFYKGFTRERNSKTPSNLVRSVNISNSSTKINTKNEFFEKSLLENEAKFKKNSIYSN